MKNMKLMKREHYKLVNVHMFTLQYYIYTDVGYQMITMPYGDLLFQ